MTTQTIRDREDAMTLLEERAEYHSKRARECATKGWRDFHSARAGAYRDAVSIVRQADSPSSVLSVLSEE